LPVGIHSSQKTGINGTKNFGGIAVEVQLEKGVLNTLEKLPEKIREYIFSHLWTL